MTSLPRPRVSIAACAALMVLSSPVTSPQTAVADTSCPFTYTNFETIIPHIDMDACPDTGIKTEVFCRAATSQDQLHVFVFAADGDQCLLKVMSLNEEAFELELKK